MSKDFERSESGESPEAKAEEELLSLGLQTVPENIRTVLKLQETLQHPEGYENIVESEDWNEIAGAMEQKNISHVVHAEGPTLWEHCKLAMKLAEFLPLPDDRKADLKLVLLYHDFGKTNPALYSRGDVKTIQKKELGKGKLYRVAKGHALESSDEIRDGFRANGISGKKMKMFMNVVRNHMETQLANLPGEKLVGLFGQFGPNDEQRKEYAEMLAWVVQLDSNASAQMKFNEQGELSSMKNPNTTGRDFETIWQKYLDNKGGYRGRDY